MTKQNTWNPLNIKSVEGQSPWLPILVTIVSKTQETNDSITLELDVGKDYTFEPGQFNMLYAFGKGEIPISISGFNAEAGILKHTIRAVGNISRSLCEAKVGEKIGIRGPYGTDWPIKKAFGKNLIVIAGGIGLAPVRPVIEFALANEGKFESFTLLIGTRSPSDLLFQGQVEDWIASSKTGSRCSKQKNKLNIIATVDEFKEGWKGQVGMVTSLWDNIPQISPNTVAMTCGPEIMMRYVIFDLLKFHVPAENIYLSMERNMKCAIGLCGHCLYGPKMMCRDGAVFSYPDIKELMSVREL